MLINEKNGKKDYIIKKIGINNSIDHFEVIISVLFKILYFNNIKKTSLYCSYY